MIVSLGESLIDRFHSSSGAPTDTRIGGSPYNVANALANLGVPSGYLCPISTDPFGDALAEGLQRYGTRQCVAERVAAPTAIADIRTNSKGHPQYTFHREGTADRALVEQPPTRSLPTNTHAVHFGSLTLAQQEDWPHWRAAIVAAKNNGAFVALDPNLRPALIDDLTAYAKRLEEAVALADWVKASDEDLKLLHPEMEPIETIQYWRGKGRTVVLTRGESGAQLWTPDGGCIAHPAGTARSIADTVGAGDTYQAATLAWLWHHNALHTRLTESSANALMRFAATAAAINCERPGCQPPTHDEVMQRL